MQIKHAADTCYKRNVCAYLECARTLKRTYLVVGNLHTKETSAELRVLKLIRQQDGRGITHIGLDDTRTPATRYNCGYDLLQKASHRRHTCNTPAVVKRLGLQHRQDRSSAGLQHKMQN